MTDSRPLAGLRVLDLSQGIAGPHCGGLFAEFGAEVIKIEPPAGDWMRPLGPGHDNLSSGFMYYNRGKESLCLDIKAEGAIDIVLELAARSDVLIENNRPGISARLGFGFEAIKKLQPKIIYVSVSGLGQIGPDIKLPLSDTVAQARSGMMSINRGRADIPARIGTTIIDAITGLYGFQAASMALWGDPAKREAKHLDVSLLQSAAAVQGPKVMEFGIVGQSPKTLNAPAGSYATSDGYVAVSLVRESDWEALCKVIKREDFLEDPRYATFPDRADQITELTERLEEIFKQSTTADWIERMSAAGILVARINDFGDWTHDPQTVATEGAPSLNVTPGHKAPIARTPGQESNTMLSPQLGQHSRKILAEAGLADDRIEALIQAGAVLEHSA